MIGAADPQKQPRSARSLESSTMQSQLPATCFGLHRVCQLQPALLLAVIGMFALTNVAFGKTLRLPQEPKEAPAKEAQQDLQIPEGFMALFNGKDFSGWYGRRDQSPQRWSLLDEESRKKWLAEDQANMQAHWTIENGEIVNDGQGVFLATEKEFGNFELLIEYKTVANADSGIYLKAHPQVQIWDYTEAGGKWNIGADKGSGGLWNNSPGAPGKDPLVLADRPFGQWNQFRIRQIGQRTSVWLNDQLVVDHAIMENLYDRSQPLPPRGPILLQTHGGEIRWRNIFIREIPTDEAVNILAEKAATAEDQALFDGKTLNGWQGSVDSYQVVDGAIQCKSGQGGNLFTEKEYADFVAHFQFKLPKGGNNGLAIRYPGKGNPAYDGMCELQILDADYPGKLDPRQVHGSAYGMVAAATGYLHPAGNWNHQIVTVRGSGIQVELNGSIILNTDLSKVTDFMADSPHPGKDRKSGYFGFAGHNDPVQFREIYVRELPPQE